MAEQIQNRRYSRTVTAGPQERRYDVQDKNGVWRVGHCENFLLAVKEITLDGFHPAHNSFYCDHSEKLQPIRTKTKGLTTPEGKPIRTVLTISEIEIMNNKLVLNSMKSSQLENNLDNIRVFIRTEIIILVDKIVNTSFEIIGTIKMADLVIGKFFMGVISFYVKMLESAKKFMLQLETNQVARELFLSMQELAISVKMIVGLSKRSQTFFEDPLNRSIRSEGMIDCLIKSEDGVLPFLHLLRGMATVSVQDFTVVMQSVDLFIYLCEKRRGELLEGNLQQTTSMVLEDILNFIRSAVDKNEEIWRKLKSSLELVSRIETIYLILHPNKVCPLRKVVERDPNTSKATQQTSVKPKKEADKIRELQERLAKLETILPTTAPKEVEAGEMPTENMSEQTFLSSLEWALETGDLESCKLLVKWRKSLLQLGRIAGWEVALAVGSKTYRRKVISPEDIIQANFQFVRRQSRVS